MEPVTMSILKKVWEWLRSLFFIGSNLVNVLEGLKKIEGRLVLIEEDIKSPQYQLAELEKIKTTIDLLKENNEQETKKLLRGSQEEIDTHKSRAEKLTEENKALLKFEYAVQQAIGIIEDKDRHIKELNAQLEKLKSNTPSALALALAGVDSRNREAEAAIARFFAVKKSQEEKK